MKALTKTLSQRQLQRWVSVAATLLLILLTLQGEGPAPQDLKFRLQILSDDRAFNFFAWELQALARKAAFGLLAPQRFMTQETRARFVLHYLDQVQEARHLADEIDRAYTNPVVAHPEIETEPQQAALADLRDEMQRSGLVAEAILGEQVGLVLREGGFGLMRQILPPVSATFTPLPYLLVVSPREVIESIYQRPLEAGLTAAQQTDIEQDIEGELPEYATYVTGIGGLAAYPAMLLESSSIDWVSDVIAHEWTHHYLVFHPLGLYYDRSGETRTINETSASLVGEWAGQEVILRFYAPLLDRAKPLPQPLSREETEQAEAPRFDFRAEMHHTRVIVDEMLAEGRVAAAEWYMEAQRRYFFAHGYRLRRLNQAYFAFHGAYASASGAAGADPIGPAVRRLWSLSPSPRAFTRAVAPVTTLEELQAVLTEH
jgi:hypothetical protein